MDSEVTENLFPLLSLPAEIRDMVYEHVLFASACTTNVPQRQANLEKGVEIHTNILFTNHQVFQEARNVIIGAQLVQVISQGGKLQKLRQGATVEDGIPLFHTRYRLFCLLKHVMDEDYPGESGCSNDDISYIIRMEDVYQFCRGLFKLDSACPSTQTFDPDISHNLVLVKPEGRLPPGPAHVSITVPGHENLLKIYQKVLGGCQDICISAHSSVEPDPGFMKDMVEQIRSGNTTRS